MKLFDLDELTARRIGRRSLLRALGIGVVAAPLVKLLGSCGGDDAIAGGDVADGTVSGDGSESGDEAIVATGWATGGTAAMTAKSGYPDPFAGLGSRCELLCEATLGPCHAATSERQDVSEGTDGLPIRLSLRVVDGDCEPIDGAIVEIWHTNYQGTYSGNINQMCNTTPVERAAAWFRGYQRTSADGRVDFDTCFPGWYRGRAVHIHFRIMIGDYDGADAASAVVVSQLFFAEDLIDEVFGGEPLYERYGDPDTRLARDGVIGGEDDPAPYLLDTARMSDGAMLASKTLVVRNNTATTNCSLAGAKGSGGAP